jgi:hypothetical protein
MKAIKTLWQGFKGWQKAAAASQTAVYAIGECLYW